MTAPKPLVSALVLAAALAALPVGGHTSQTPAERYNYAGFLQDAQVLTLQIDVAAANSTSYQMSMEGDLIGMLSSMFPFQMQMTSQGHFNSRGSQPVRYHSDIATNDERRTVTLNYGAGGAIQMLDRPATQEGQQAFARGLVSGTIDPLSAIAMIARNVDHGRDCGGRVRVFDGARRFDLSLTPVPRSVSAPRNMPAGLKSAPTGCDAAMTFISGFPQSAIDSGAYPRTARFWFTSDLNSPWPVLLRADADSGLGHLHLDFVGVQTLR